MARDIHSGDGWGWSLAARPDDDPSLIILRSDSPPPAAAPSAATSLDPRERALMRAGFRSTAGNRFLQAMRTTQETTFGNPDLADGEAETRFLREADAARRASLEAAGRMFPDVEPPAREAVGEGLSDVMAAVRAQGLKSRAILRERAAFDALEAEGDDLASQVRRDPDRYEAYVPLVPQAVSSFEPVLTSEQRQNFIGNAQADLATAQVEGFAEQGRFEEAHAALARLGSRLPPDRNRWLQKAVARRERAAQGHAAAQRIDLMRDLAARIEAESETEADLALARQQLAPPQLRHLQTLADEVAAREAANAPLLQAAADVALGGEWPANLDARQRARGVALFWQRMVERRVAAMTPRDWGALVVASQGQLGGMSPAVSRILSVWLEPGETPERRLAAAATMVALIEDDPGLLARFRPDERALADYIEQVRTAGGAAGGDMAPDDAAALLARADAKRPLQTPGTEPDGPELPELPDTLPGGVAGTVVGTHAMAEEAGGVRDAPVLFDADALAEREGPDDEDAAAAAGFASDEELARWILEAPDARWLEPGLGMSLAVRNLPDGRQAVVRLETRRDDAMEGAFQVAGLAVREADWRPVGAIPGPELPIERIKPLLTGALGETDADGVPAWIEVIDPETGAAARIDREKFFRLGELMQAYVESNGTLGEEERREAGLLVLSLLPGIGEAISAVEAFDAFAAAATAYANGDTDAMREALLDGTLAAAGAIPVLGGWVRLGRVGLRLAELVGRVTKPVLRSIGPQGHKLERYLQSTLQSPSAQRRQQFREVLGDDYNRQLAAANEDRKLAEAADILGDEERVAVNMYTTEAGERATYKVTNQGLRDGSWAENARIAALVPVLDDALDRLPKFTGTVYRRSDLPPDQAARLVSGEGFDDAAFLSTSRSPELEGFDGKYHFEIETRSGSDIADYSRFVSESEILIPRGVMFDVIEVSPLASDVLFVKLRERWL